MPELPESVKPIFAEAERQFNAISKNVGGFQTAEEALYHITEIAQNLCLISNLAATILLFEYPDWMEKTPRNVNTIIGVHRNDLVRLTILEVVRFLLLEAIEDHLQERHKL